MLQLFPNISSVFKQVHALQTSFVKELTIHDNYCLLREALFMKCDFPYLQYITYFAMFYSIIAYHAPE